jgi:hypothetical protein
LLGLTQQATAVISADAALSGQVNQGADTLASRQQALIDAIDRFGRDHPAIRDSADYQRSAGEHVICRLLPVAYPTCRLRPDLPVLGALFSWCSREAFREGFWA